MGCAYNKRGFVLYRVELHKYHLEMLGGGTGVGRRPEKWKTSWWGFLNLGTIATWVWLVLWCRGLSCVLQDVEQRPWSLVRCQCPTTTSSTPVICQYLQTMPNVPLRQNLPDWGFWKAHKHLQSFSLRIYQGPAVWPSASHCSFLSACLFLCAVGIMRTPTAQRHSFWV